MSELDQTIEELEAEVLAELEEAAHDAPTKGSAGAEPMKKVKKVGPPQSDEMQDGGDPVVEPDAADSPTDVAADKAKEVSGDEQQKDEGKPDPMKKVKKVKEDAEMDEDEEMGNKSKEELMAAMYAEMETMGKKDLMATYGMMKKEDGHLPSEKNEEVVEDYIKSIDVSSDINALVDGEDLSEEFKEKAATIFEAAVKSKTRKELTRITEDQQVAMAIEIDEYKDTLSEKVDQYLDYVVEEWMKENELAIERGLKGEIAEDFISGLKQLFEDHYIDVPNEKYNVLEAQSEKIAELEEQLNGIMEQNIEMKTANSDLVREQVVLEAASELTDTQFEKFKSLTEEIDFKNQDTFREKLDTLKESYFPKVNSDQTYDNDDDYGSAEQDIDTTNAMKAYMSAIGRTEKRIKGAV
jgi:hypothetical protein|tara:strand:- start:815 stop:2044 length:1230 start_codon:yes stop_codon:yes gene_type:complete